MSARSHPARRTALLAALVATAPLALSAAPSGAAPVPRAAAAAAGTTGDKTVWDEADKTAFGTSRSRVSNVWFTMQQGHLSEMFYPDLSTPSVRALELVVTDGATFTDRVSLDTDHAPSRPDPRSLRFTEVDTATSGKYRIEQTVVTDPDRDAVRVKVRLKSLDGEPYKLYAVLDPALDNGGNDDTSITRGRALVATDDHTATVLTSAPSFGPASNGLLGVDDGWTDLADDHVLDNHSDFAGPGNVVQTGLVRNVDGTAGHRSAVLTLGFGGTIRRALLTNDASADDAFGATAASYDNGWHRYLGGLRDVPASASGVRAEYLASALALAAAEDKLNPGAFVASPSAPWVWGDEVDGLSSPSGAYHLVWSRDAYEFGTALWAMGDKAAARRIVDWLFLHQQKADGSFPQNSDVSGEPVWSELQLDEVALPIALANLTGEDSPRIYRHVKKAATFLADFEDEDAHLAAPYSPQERWENQSGYSPNSIAAQIDGMLSAAAIARAHGDRASARTWRGLADDWQAKVKDWTVTTNGPLSDDPYFLRLTKDGDPNAGTTYGIGDGGPSDADQREVVDQSFLDLVRYGIIAPDDPAVVNTLAVIDDELKVMTPNGPFWHRFSFDGYGETATGEQWDITEPDTHTTHGRGWPLLTGERGEYAVTAGLPAQDYLATMAAAAGPSGLLAEQVWDGEPPTGDPCCPSGEGTRSATPLTWSHAGLVRLAWTIQRGHPVDQQAVVADRYLE